MTMETQQSERIKAYDAPIIDVQKDKGIVRAYINKFNIIDSYDEMSLPGSFTKTFNDRLKKMWWLLNHDFDRSLGVTLSLEEDSTGAIATGKFNLEKEIARDTFSDYLLFAENGRTLQHSVRVMPVKYTIENDVMRVSEWKMTEWSTLTRPGAIEDTPMISIKQATENADLLRKALKLDYSDEKLKQFEEKLNGLETLIREAVIDTSVNQPNKRSSDIKSIVESIQKISL